MEPFWNIALLTCTYCWFLWLSLQVCPVFSLVLIFSFTAVMQFFAAWLEMSAVTVDAGCSPFSEEVGQWQNYRQILEQIMGRTTHCYRGCRDGPEDTDLRNSGKNENILRVTVKFDLGWLKRLSVAVPSVNDMVYCTMFAADVFVAYIVDCSIDYFFYWRFILCTGKPLNDEFWNAIALLFVPDQIWR